MYSDDLRKAANNAYIVLQSYRKVAICFGLAHSTIWRWLRTRKKEKNLQKTHGEWIRCAMVIAFIRQVVRDTPFVTRIELRKRINLVFQFTPSLKLVSNALKHAGISKVKCRTRCVGKSPATQSDHETFSCLWGQGDAVAIDNMVEDYNFRRCTHCVYEQRTKLRSRDWNAALNIRVVVMSILRGEDRPEYLNPERTGRRRARVVR